MFIETIIFFIIKHHQYIFSFANYLGRWRVNNLLSEIENTKIPWLTLRWKSVVKWSFFSHHLHQLLYSWVSLRVENQKLFLMFILEKKVFTSSRYCRGRAIGMGRTHVGEILQQHIMLSYRIMFQIKRDVFPSTTYLVNCNRISVVFFREILLILKE